MFGALSQREKWEKTVPGNSKSISSTSKNKKMRKKIRNLKMESQNLYRVLPQSKRWEKALPWNSKSVLSTSTIKKNEKKQFPETQNQFRALSQTK